MNKENGVELQKSETTPPYNGERQTIVWIKEAKASIFTMFSKRYEQKIDNNIKEAREKILTMFEENLKDKGLMGEHELLAPANVERGLWANMNGEWKMKGFMFFIIGSVKGNGKLEGGARTVSSVQFAWKPNEKDILITEIPVDKLVFREDSSVKIPRVSFTFNAGKFIDPPRRDKGLYYSLTTFPYPNDYLMGERLSRATFTTSSLKDLKGLPLPREKNQ